MQSAQRHGQPWFRLSLTGAACHDWQRWCPFGSVPDLPPLLDQHLAPFRLCMLFMASPDLPDDLLGEWPTLWAQGRDGAWRSVVFGRSHQARRLACLLIVNPQGLSAKQAGRALSPAGVDGKGERQNAKRYLLEALHDVAAEDLLVLPERGGRGAPPWALRHATTDIAIAADAAGRGQWTLAAALTHGGNANLAGIPAPGSPSAGWKAALPLSAVRTGRERGRGSLPAELADRARVTASRVRSHRTDWRDFGPLHHPVVEAELGSPPPVEIEAVLEGVVVSPDASDPRRPGNLPPGVRPATPAPRRSARTLGQLVPAVRHLELPRSSADDIGYELTVIPLGQVVKRGRAASRRSLTAVIGIPVIGIAVVIIGRATSDRQSSRTSAAGTRAEQETFAHSVKTFSSPTQLNAAGPAIAAGAIVQVSCRIYAPSIASVSPDGFWYRISSPPWNNRYYTPANTFLNGDAAARFLRGTHAKPSPVHNTDFAVAPCGGPSGSLETPRAPTTTTFTNLATGTPRGPMIGAKTPVVVSCRVYTPQVPSTVPQGYAYRIASPPWNDRAYAPARDFLNGDPAKSHPTRLADAAVPGC